MGHEVDWSKFPKPWDRIGPSIQDEFREDVKRICAGKPAIAKPIPPERYATMPGYADRFR